MFKRISYIIALQFTLFVFVLFMVNGAIFLAADFSNARRQSQARLQRTLQDVITIRNINGQMPPHLRDRVRIVDDAWTPLYAGGFFDEIPLERIAGLSRINIHNEQYSILTAPITVDAEVRGYIQVADVERFQRSDLPLRALLYLFVSAAISLLTFIVGLFFARSSLQPAERMMKQLEQFTQDASHELRTPLTMLNSSLDLALKNEKYKEGILSAKEDVKQVSELVERLLDFTRIDALTIGRASLDMSLLVDQTIEKYQLLAKERGITIEKNIAQNIRVNGDMSLLRQMIGNLLSNAIKYNNDNGTITVSLTKHKLKVEDSGIGIDAQNVPHIFDRFYQVDASRSKGGVGLGLAFTKKIVELHGWRIAVASNKGKGTTFTVSLNS